MPATHASHPAPTKGVRLRRSVVAGGWAWGRSAAERPPGHESELRGLMTMAAHDLRSPLTAAAANLELLREDHIGQFSDDGEQCLRATERALGRLNGLVEDLLVYATADQWDLDLHPVSLDEEIAERLTDVDGETLVAGPLPTVLADRRLLGHVLDNLIGNAM